MSTTHRTLLIGIVTLFLLVRIPALHLSYYQDEFKSVAAAETSLAAANSFFTHPPLTALLLRSDAIVFGGSGMRVLPLLFGLLSVGLLFAVVRRRFDTTTALWSAALYTVSFYGIWASLMVDTDGAILPTLFLAAVYCYDRLRGHTDQMYRWGILLALAVLTGLFVKLSFVLVPAALILDFFLERRRLFRLPRVSAIGFGLLGLGIVLVLAVLLVRLALPAFQFGGMIAHARAYMHLTDRNYLQVLVQGVKAVYYLSPLLLVPLLFLTRDLLWRARVFATYLVLGFVFYFILFDFSRGALDKYLMFTIVPLAVLAGSVFGQVSVRSLQFPRLWVGAGAVAAALVVAAAFLPQTVVPLYPKSAWFLSVLHGRLNVLTPFNGGSGPLGFYVSFLVIFLGYLTALSAAVLGRVALRFRHGALLVVLLAGLAYNAVFWEEFAFGKIHGSASVVLQDSLAFIGQRSDIGQVLTYNDIGAYELVKMGKYAGRFYAAPQFEAGHAQLFAAYEGAYLVVGVPPLYDGFYSRFFSQCASVFQTRSGVILSTIYTCQKTKK
ncbi:MAG: glycosyltransferase family 39 protein [Candidatus Paceibacterota bacterium]|jgi:hypothetical protein